MWEGVSVTQGAALAGSGSCAPLCKVFADTPMLHPAPLLQASGVSRKTPLGANYEELVELAGGALQVLTDRAATLPRNYVLDQDK